MNSKKTEELVNELRKAKDVDEFLKNNSKQFNKVTVSEYLNSMMIKYGIEKNALISKAGVVPSYAYQILDGRKNASRDKLIQMALGFPLTIDETNTLMRCGGYSELYVRSKRDVLLIYALQKHYDILQTNEMLMQNSEDTL